MAKEFVCPEDDCAFTDWTETETDLIERAREHLTTEHDHSLSDEEIRDHVQVIPTPSQIKSGVDGVMDERSRRIGERAAREIVEDGMDVGLGTGSTAAWAVAEIGRLLDEDELHDIRGVATSLQSHELAKEAGIPLTGLDEVTTLDVAIDGADQYSEQEPTVVKGGGAAHSREKVVDTAADRFVIVTDEDRATDPLDFPVPVEVLPDARTLVAEWVREQGGIPSLRMMGRAADGPLVTANGNLLLDCDFGGIEDPTERADALAALPGVVDHGLFVDMVDEFYIGTDGDVMLQ
jgi:ribose 5-phosphate isomerase A